MASAPAVPTAPNALVEVRVLVSPGVKPSLVMVKAVAEPSEISMRVATSPFRNVPVLKVLVESMIRSADTIWPFCTMVSCSPLALKNLISVGSFKVENVTSGDVPNVSDTLDMPPAVKKTRKVSMPGPLFKALPGYRLRVELVKLLCESL